MPKMDCELIMDKVETLLKAGLPAKLTEISTEKGDGLELVAPAAGSYFRSMNEGIANVNPLVLIYEADVEAEGIGPQTARTLKIEIDILVADDAQGAGMLKRMMRYRRALEEVLTEAWDKIGFGVKLRVSGLPAVTLQIAGRSAADKVVGVIVEATIRG